MSTNKLWKKWKMKVLWKAILKVNRKNKMVFLKYIKKT